MWRTLHLPFSGIYDKKFLPRETFRSARQGNWNCLMMFPDFFFPVLSGISNTQSRLWENGISLWEIHYDELHFDNEARISILPFRQFSNFQFSALLLSSSIDAVRSLGLIFQLLIAAKVALSCFTFLKLLSIQIASLIKNCIAQYASQKS